MKGYVHYSDIRDEGYAHPLPPYPHKPHRLPEAARVVVSC